MSTQDTCCSVIPYFEVAEEHLPAFKALCEKAVETAQKEEKCLYYGFSFNGGNAFCREGYEDAQGLLDHVSNIGPVLKEMLAISKLVKFEIHGPESQLAQLREPLDPMAPKFYVLECGFRRS